MPSNDGRAHALAPSLSGVFDRQALSTARVRVDAQQSIYATGDDDDAMYLIESGQVKLFMSSESGKDCLLAIYTAGEIFGESCFTGNGRRFESASAMQPTIVRRASRKDFVAEVQRANLMEALLRHLANRAADRQTAVFDLITMDAEKRLAKVLLNIAEKVGTVDGEYLRIEQRISQEELSQIVGTTRPRITAFMQGFRRMGMVGETRRGISVHLQKVRAFLDVQF
jgi:CRP/FNR family transcriptional regulator, cyclic AMP receptor protein